MKMNSKPVRYRESFGTYLVNINQVQTGGRANWLDLPKAGPKPVTVKRKTSRKSLSVIYPPAGKRVFTAAKSV